MWRAHAPVTEAFLHLKDGETRAIAVPDVPTLREALHYMRMPRDAAGRTVRLAAVEGAAMDVPAGAIAGVEIPPPHAVVRDFMTDAEMEKVLAFAHGHAGAFQTAGHYEQGGDTTKGRRARLLDGPANAEMAALIFPKLKAAMPSVWPQLRTDPVPLQNMECQVTAHGDGDFFAIHRDNEPADIAYRRISYVYYFHREPKQFSGGHLRLYHTLIQSSGGTCGRLGADIAPPRNGVVIFPTHIFHEVAPLASASRALDDQRLTLNGWLF